jgi:hypothetical protein
MSTYSAQKETAAQITREGHQQVIGDVGEGLPIVCRIA